MSSIFLSMKKNKISRKEFIVKTSKVAGGLFVCPAIISVLHSCSSDPASSNESQVDEMFSECPCHQARFNVEGAPIQGPNNSSPESITSLEQYSSELNENEELIIENNLSLDVSALEVGSAIMLNENSVDGSGLLIYRKTETQFNVLSRECTHNGCSIGAFQEP